MKLWPFSKKPGNPTTESHFELPPGVMLASPDEASSQPQAPSTPGRYDAMHADEPATHAAEPAEPSPEAKPDLPQFVEQNQLEFISHQASAAPPLPEASSQAPVLPETPEPQNNLIQPTKAELYQEINNSLTSLYEPTEAAPQPENPDQTPAMLTDQELEELLNKPVLAQPLPEHQTPVAQIDFGLPAKKEPNNNPESITPEPIFGIGGTFESPTEEIDLDAILYGPAAPENKPEAAYSPQQGEPVNLDFLVPPPVSETQQTPESLLMPPASEQQASLEETFTLPDYLPGIDPGMDQTLGDFAPPLCDLSSDLAAPPPLADGFAADELQQMADFLGADFLPQTEPIPSLPEPYSASPEAGLPPLQEPLPDPLEELLKEAATYPEPEAATDFGFHAAPEPAQESGLLAFTSMGSFDEFAVPDSLFQPTASIAAEPDSSPTVQPDPQPEYTAPTTAETYYEAGNTLQNAGEDEESSYNTDDSEYESGGSDFTSYDFGHYDDPDHPAEAFVLSNDSADHEPSETTQPTHGHYSEPATDLQAMAHFLGAAAYEANAPEPDEPAQEEPCYAAEHPPEDIDTASTEDNSAQTATHSEAPATTSESRYQHPVPRIQPAASREAASKPHTEPAAAPYQEAAKTKAVPRQSQPYSPQPRRLYHDSVTEALQDFQEEMLLEDSRFLRNSINNLVDHYFSNRES